MTPSEPLGPKLPNRQLEDQVDPFWFLFLGRNPSFLCSPTRRNSRLLQRPALELSVEKRQPKQRTFSKEKMAETNKHGSYDGLKAKTSCWTYYIVAMKKPRRWLHLLQLSLPFCLMWWIRHSKPNRLWGEKNSIEAIYIELSGTFLRPLDWLWKCVKLL